MSEEPLQIAEERREVKGNEERERHTKLDAEFQRVAMRDEKAFLNEQCKETEENNRMGKTRHLILHDSTCVRHINQPKSQKETVRQFPAAGRG